MAWSFCCRAKERLWEKISTARIDRRQYVPLLAQTLRGVEYRDGRHKAISNYWLQNTAGLVKLDAGTRPYDITTDGKFIWCTDTASADNSLLKLRRDASAVEKIFVGQKSWGLAFDGAFMWVTHPEIDAVSRISTKAKRGNKPERSISLKRNPNERLEPKAIIFAPEWMWIARRSGVSRIHVKTCQREHFDLDFTPFAMAFDGTFIWLLYFSENKSSGIGKIDLNGKAMKLDLSLALDPAQSDIVFDGTHIWVSHAEGVTQVDVDEHIIEKTVGDDQVFGNVAFDGAYLWVTEPNVKRVHKIDVFLREPLGDLRPLETILSKERRHFGKLCFDGTYLWLTDCIGVDEQTGQGLIYRFLI